MLTPNAPASPIAAVKRAFQWSPAALPSVLIFLSTRGPVRITAVTVREPCRARRSPSPVRQYLSNSYVYF